MDRDRANIPEPGKTMNSRKKAKGILRGRLFKGPHCKKGGGQKEFVRKPSLRAEEGRGDAAWGGGVKKGFAT